MIKLITKNTYLTLFFLATANFLFGQVTRQSLPKLKINLNSGITYTQLFGNEPLYLKFCIEGCEPLDQKTSPGFAYGITVTKLMKKRHYLGIGYNRYRIHIDQTLDDYFAGIIPNRETIKYHSLYVLHQYRLRSSKRPIFWNNSIGVDSSNNGRTIKRGALFYRTGLEYGFNLGKLKLALNPYFQIGLTSYTKKIFQGSKVMRPYSFGLNVQIPLSFS